MKVEKLQKCNQIRRMTEERQTMWLKEIGEGYVFKVAERYGVIFGGV